MDELISGLIAEMAKMRVIDSHEHMPTEEEVVAREADVFTRIYCHYSLTNAISAGMAATDRDVLKDTRLPIEERWRIFSPYRRAMEETGYARAARITARDLYGIEEINDHTYLELSHRLQAANKPGLFDRVLKDKCKIERVLNQGSWHDGKGGFAVPVYRAFMRLAASTPEALRTVYDEWKTANGADFDDATAWVAFWCARLAEEGHVGLKFSAALPADCVDDSTAGALFRKLKDGSLKDDEAPVLGTWLMHKAIETAPQSGLVVAVHCGIIWNCWGDFTALNPLNLIPLVMKYRSTTFDLYHGGIPWVREIAVMANQYPNVCLDLIWCHQISPYMTEQMLNEWIDLVPLNKIIGFGGDNCDSPDNTYGVLAMTRENIARALAVRISRGQLSESRGVEICEDWLHHNPARIYGL